MNILNEISGINLIDSEALWKSIHGVKQEDKISAFLDNAGVEFFDEEKRFINKPVAAITGMGGMPVSESGIDYHQFIDIIRHNTLKMMGFSGNYSYMNPKNLEPEEMFSRTSEHGHFSTAHTVYINMLVAGHSCAVENEFNSQRDNVHLSRITVARTGAQNNPPVVVLYPDHVPAFKEILDNTKEVLSKVRTTLLNPSNGSDLDFKEVCNTAYPAAKGQAMMISGTLRNFQNIVGALSDSGKEEEYKRILALINDNLNTMWPEIFKPTKDYGYSFPVHWGE